MDLMENALAQLIEQLENRIELAQSGGKTISDDTVVSKGITLFDNTGVFNEDIREWRRQTTDQKTWAHYKLFLTKHINIREEQS